MQTSNSPLLGTASGTLLSVLPNLNSEDVLKTIVLAILGAIVSFCITILLKKLVRNGKK
jgi:mannitol-specific phosphotransferase system IIBC component